MRGAVDVVGIEARGFILGAAVAYHLGSGFVPVRKSGKLPGPSLREEYTLEYGSASSRFTRGRAAGRTALIVDDVLATGGTVARPAASSSGVGATVVGIDIVLELDLPRRPRQGRRPPAVRHRAALILTNR